MRSDSAGNIELERQMGSRVVYRLMDPAFGLFVWIGHLVMIYVAHAVSCGVGFTTGNPGAQAGLVIALAAVTLIAVAVVGVHGLRRYREQPQTHNHRFLLRMAVGQDAIAALAILWQLIPIFMSPVCR